jgi:hypothetical protein
MEDETDCAHSNCKAGAKKCANGVGCYYEKCDGYTECEDGSDEVNPFFIW